MSENESNHKKRVLVVDDEPGVVKVLGIKLKLAGYGVITTTSGAEAIELVKSESPDLVVLDILMPEVTGFDVLAKVRAFSQVPILVFTARPDIFKTAMSKGANDCIAKPFNPDHLVDKIAVLLSGRKDNKPGARDSGCQE